MLLKCGTKIEFVFNRNSRICRDTFRIYTMYLQIIVIRVGSGLALNQNRVQNHEKTSVDDLFHSPI